MKNESSHQNLQKNTCGILLAIFFSLFFGIFLGFLLAPQSGKRFRESLRGWLNEMVEKGKFTIEEAKVYSSELLDKSKDKVESFSTKIKGE
jgi:gas vesicle protein